MFLMFQLARPDVLAVGDLGIRRAVERAYGLRDLPSAAELRELAEPWRPHRTAACLLLWHSLDNAPEVVAGAGRSSVVPAQTVPGALRGVLDLAAGRVPRDVVGADVDDRRAGRRLRQIARLLGGERQHAAGARRARRPRGRRRTARRRGVDHDAVEDVGALVGEHSLDGADLLARRWSDGRPSARTV